MYIYRKNVKKTGIGLLIVSKACSALVEFSLEDCRFFIRVKFVGTSARSTLADILSLIFFRDYMPLVANFGIKQTWR